MRGERGGYTGAGSTFDAKKGWSSSGKLITGESTKSASLQAAFPEADVYTVQFSVDPPHSRVYRAVATIIWTVEGNQISRMVDVANGVSLSSPSQAVKIIVNDLTTVAEGGTPGQDYGVTISIVRGTRAYTGIPATLKAAESNGIISALALPIGGGLTYPIPPNAGVISVSVTALPASGTPPSDFAIGHTNAASIVMKIYSYNDPEVGPEFIAVSPLATIIALTNIDATRADSVSVTWGIDG